jgi:5'(3')-deoxyribonucleotidase
MKPLTINLDMDGVIYDFTAQLHSYAEIALDRNLPEFMTWSAWAEWGISKSEFYHLFHRAIAEDELFSRGMAIDGALDAVWALADAGHRLRIVTSKRLRNDSSTLQAQKQTLTWLYTHGILGVVEVAFTSDKQGYLADVVVDDKPTLAWAQRGALNILFDQPWNRTLTFEGRPPAGFKCAYSWPDALELIAKVEPSDG